MKIALGSDIHLEFGPIKLKNTEAAEVLILAGDICVAQHFKAQDKFIKRYMEFFKQCAEEFPHVVYVVGNHEHYNGDFAHTVAILRTELKAFKNIHILDNETFVLGDVTFIGTTLWTNMNMEDPLTLYSMKDLMNDFRCIKNSDNPIYRTVPLFLKDENDNYVLDENGDYIPSGSKQKAEASRFSPEDAVVEHRKALDYIDAVIGGKGDDKFVVVGHHCPSHQSVHEKYKHDTIMNGGFTSDLDDYIAYRPQIVSWHHGHTHERFKYQIGNTWITCNPRGYINYEAQADSFKLRYYEINKDGSITFSNWND